MLTVKHLSASRGETPVLHRVSLAVKEHTVTAVLGANGAGKTTLLSVLSGLIPATDGSVLWNNTNLLSLEPHEILRLGIASVPEGRRVFFDLSVTENLQVGGTLLSRKEMISRTDAMFTLFPRLKERKKTPAGMLSGGEQQMLAMARALMTRPQLLLLDEPCMGLSPAMTKEIYALIKNLQEDTSILLVEQNARAALSLSQEAFCLANGKIVLSGKSRDLLNSSAIQKTYLGEHTSSNILTTQTPHFSA